MGHASAGLSGTAAIRSFVDELQLPRPFRVLRGLQADQTIADQFEATKNQAFVVGSEIVSFVSGLTPPVREVIVTSSLLAQLAANHRVPALDNTRSWYEAYFDTLVHLGWAIQERGFSEHREAGDDFDAHQAILSVAEVILGPGTAALKVVASTLGAMKQLSEGRWIKIFKRESQSARAARFQITVAEPKLDAGASVSLMAFELNATTTLTQVLFFKFRSADVTLRHSSGRVSIDVALLSNIQSTIADKVADYTRDFISQVAI